MHRVFDNVRAVKDSVSLGETITIVGGCFDLLHVGHLHLLEYAKTLGNVLVVSLLSDSNIRSYKGVGKPVIKEEYRAILLSSLRCVDRVYISDVSSSHPETLTVLQPNNIVFGVSDTEDWKWRIIEKERFIKSQYPDTKIHYLKRFPDKTISTSSLIHRIKVSRYCASA